MEYYFYIILFNIIEFFCKKINMFFWLFTIFIFSNFFDD